MINNLTLKLDEVDAAVLGAPINMEEVQEVLRKVPKAKNTKKQIDIRTFGMHLKGQLNDKKAASAKQKIGRAHV